MSKKIYALVGYHPHMIYDRSMAVEMVLKWFYTTAPRECWSIISSILQ